MTKSPGNKKKSKLKGTRILLSVVLFVVLCVSNVAPMAVVNASAMINPTITHTDTTIVYTADPYDVAPLFTTNTDPYSLSYEVVSGPGVITGGSSMRIEGIGTIRVEAEAQFRTVDYEAQWWWHRWWYDWPWYRTSRYDVATITVTKGTGVATISVPDYEAGGRPSPTVSSTTNDPNQTGQYNIKYAREGSSTYLQMPTDVGTYVAKVTYPETDFYYAAVATTTFKVTERVNMNSGIPPIPDTSVPAVDNTKVRNSSFEPYVTPDYAGASDAYWDYATGKAKNSSSNSSDSNSGSRSTGNTGDGSSSSGNSSSLTGNRNSSSSGEARGYANGYGYSSNDGSGIDGSINGASGGSGGNGTDGSGTGGSSGRNGTGGTGSSSSGSGSSSDGSGNGSSDGSGNGKNGSGSGSSDGSNGANGNGSGTDADGSSSGRNGNGSGADGSGANGSGDGSGSGAGADGSGIGGLDGEISATIDENGRISYHPSFYQDGDADSSGDSKEGFWSSLSGKAALTIGIAIFLIINAILLTIFAIKGLREPIKDEEMDAEKLEEGTEGSAEERAAATAEDTEDSAEDTAGDTSDEITDETAETDTDERLNEDA